MACMKDQRAPGPLDRSAAAILVTAAFFALVTGVAEAVVKDVRIVVLHRIVWVSRDALWMTPLAYLLLYLVPAVGLAAVARLRRRGVPLTWTIAVFAFLTAFSWLLPYGQLARIASAVLAAGVGIQVARVAGRDAERWARLSRRGALALLGFVAVTAGGERVWRAVAERRGLAALPASDQARPNILFIVLDTVRRSNLSLYGHPRPTTPELERWAASSTVFDDAVASAPWTLPSHGSMFSGLTANDVGGDWTRQIRSQPRLLAEVLRAHGYVTGGFVGNLLYTSWESGLKRGFIHYYDYPIVWRVVLRHSSLGRTVFLSRLVEARTPGSIAHVFKTFDLGPSRVPADVYEPGATVTDAFLRWEPTAGPRPFFAFLNYFDAHWPEAPEPYRSRFAESPPAMVHEYDAAIAYLDHEVGRILDTLRARGVLDRTLVVVVSDHGEQYGEHGLHSHANSLYLPLLDVPLMMRYPAAVPEGRRVDALVTLRDLPATVLDLAGVPNDRQIPGRSLAQYWRTPDAVAGSDVIAEVSKGDKVDTTMPNAHGPMVSRLDSTLHYIRDGRGHEELYAWRTDSLELDNLAGDPRWRADLERLRRGLEALAPPPAAPQR